MVGPVGQRPLRCHSCTVTGDLWVPYMWGAKDLGMRARMKWNFILLLFKLMKLSFKKMTRLLDWVRRTLFCLNVFGIFPCLELVWGLSGGFFFLIEIDVL